MKKPLRSAILLCCLASLCGCATELGYVFSQGGHFLAYSTGGRSIDAMLDDPATPPETRQFLRSVRDIKGFAVERIGLKQDGNYGRFKTVDRDHIADVVQACDAVSFSAYQWRYPILGSLPYKGFYVRADAEREADRLRGQGYDVIVRKVDAFSSLGFFKDPLYSFMVKDSPFEIASLIIHEQTHATIFIKGQTKFNEELASFVGEQGAFDYLARRYGPDSRECADARSASADARLFVDFLHGLAGELDAVYKSPLPREEKLARKWELIAAGKQRFRDEYSPRFRSDGYRGVKDLPLNNAYLSLYQLYTDDAPLLRRYYTEMCGADLARFVREMKGLSAGKTPVVEAMQRELGDR